MTDHQIAPENVDEVYEALAARFPDSAHKTLARAGGLTYVPWNDVVERLNTVLGVENWSFRVIREGFTATECWVLGELTATIREVETVRQQYGVASLVTGHSDTDDLLKKAGTDALKKTAQVLGVALYLTDPEDRAEIQAAMRGAPRSNEKRTGKAAPARELCNPEGWNTRWHVAVKDTYYATDEGRHAFVSWFTEGRFKSLSEYLKQATDGEAEALVDAAQVAIDAELRAQKPATVAV